MRINKMKNSKETGRLFKREESFNKKALILSAFLLWPWSWLDLL
jgi:hypothetical protein